MTPARLLTSTLPLLFFAACEGDKGNNDSVQDTDPAELVDLDGDGSIVGDDCDDNNPAVFPGATEACDGLDNNCEGSVDEGALITFYADGDGDGYGVEASAVEACEAPSGAVALGGDCDDTNPILTPEDYDGDGLSSCDGDCDDNNANLSDRCGYSTMDGELNVLIGGCVFQVEGVDADGSTLCPACDFSFDTSGSLVSGDCIDSFDGMLGYDRDLGALSFQLYTGPGDYYNVGKFPASVTYGADYDVLSFKGYGTSGYAYSGSLNLRP